MKLKSVYLVLAVSSLSLAVAVAVAAPKNKSNPLTVKVAAVGDLQGVVEVTITNTSKHTARIPYWQLPSESPETDLFKVSYNGEEVAYEGKHVGKRALPQAKEFRMLKAGQSFRTLVDLSETYDLSRPGDYQVSFDTALQSASLSDGSMLSDDSGNALELSSAEAKLNVLGGLKAPVVPVSVASVTLNAVGYTGCSTAQVSAIDSAMTGARNYSENAKNYLNSGTAGPRYTTWFGAYSATRYNTVKSNFTKIDDALDNKNIVVNCGCSDNYYAYVYPTQPYQIYVCNAFWSAPTTGTDSKAGTLIHETSHFDIVANTDDLAYGQTAAKRLAKQPAKAIRNADSHEYFAENTPAQN